MYIWYMYNICLSSLILTSKYIKRKLSVMEFGRIGLEGILATQGGLATTLNKSESWRGKVYSAIELANDPGYQTAVLATIGLDNLDKTTQALLAKEEFVTENFPDTDAEVETAAYNAVLNAIKKDNQSK